MVAGHTGRGWADSFLRRVMDGTASDADGERFAKNPRAVDPLAGFDRHTVCLYGIKSWTFTHQVKKEDKTSVTEPLPINARTVADIGDEEMETIALAIMKLTKPGLFQTVPEREAERKNG